MRTAWMTVVGCLLIGGAVLAQQPVLQPPQQPPAQDPNQKLLDGALEDWEKAMSQVLSFEMILKKTVKDKVFGGAPLVLEGRAYYLKGGANQLSRASLELTKAGQPLEVVEKYICTGNYLYQYAPANKKVLVHPMPAPKAGAGQVSDENFAMFMFGMKSADAKSRYHMVYDMPAGKPDPYYHYIKVQPRFKQDLEEFTIARLAILKSSNLPAQLWMLLPNNNETTFDFAKITPNVNVPPTYFAVPQLPKDWQMQQMQPRPAQQPQPPSTVRSTGNPK